MWKDGTNSGMGGKLKAVKKSGNEDIQKPNPFTENEIHKSHRCRDTGEKVVVASSSFHSNQTTVSLSVTETELHTVAQTQGKADVDVHGYVSMHSHHLLNSYLH